ncbi:alpha-amylase family glycosyl hydrolase [Aureibacter tunicatorum]|uniref:1,4-alpha-glucan branching enzyme n=1 Tax=Aureibacter tunicatorum TaxID=866807 RepID=A0AAE3XLF0_9BACT|nr:alpha-amylase family glycosyl hydrolase [Aureibacter tunicatorum]MDR6238758.1 1,4-alpha-glucan branching enzyme [Aureibacter tunicatorum]BDD05311.1 alpha-amylase [Aureibacter tunicatorum]
MKNYFMIMALALMFGCNCPAEKDSQQTNQVSNPYAPKPYVEISHPEWSKNASIYEVNIRQFTPEGTFKAFEEHLPRLKELGVDILWLMPIHPIGEKNRKGEKGSYYSVKDYYAVNPEFGSMDDFKRLVNKIHGMGMHVIIDWVGNHSAWDNPLVEKHPDWYTKDSKGNFQPTPWYDWSDIIDFDYEKPEVRQYMTEALKFWVKEANIDGYRCDVAGFMPTDFWDQARMELDEIKPVFMLAEWESRDLHKKSFDMTYAWSLYREMHEVAQGKAGLGVLNEYMAHHVNTFPKDGIRMTFVDNHDKNSWEGTPFSMFGDAVEVCMVMATTVEGMPLIYSGQEAGLDRKLAFFDKDLIEWKKHPYADFYKTMLALKKENQALWNGKWGGSMIKIENSAPEKMLSFTREKNGDQIVVLLNFSDSKLDATIESDFHEGSYQEVFSSESKVFNGKDKVKMAPWGYKVFVKSGKHS